MRPSCSFLFETATDAQQHGTEISYPAESGKPGMRWLKLLYPVSDRIASGSGIFHPNLHVGSLQISHSALPLMIALYLRSYVASVWQRRTVNIQCISGLFLPHLKLT